MTNPYASFSSSEKLESEGIFIEEPTFRVRVRRAGGRNMAYKKATEAAFRPYRRAIDNGSMDEEVARRLTVKVFAETVVSGWQVLDDKTGEFVDGIHDPETGKVVTYSSEVVIAVFTKLPDLFDYVLRCATNSSLFLEDLVEADKGN